MPRDDVVVVRHFDEAGPAGAILAQLLEGCFVEVDALVPSRFVSLATHDQAMGSAGQLVDALADLVRQPVARLALWTSVVLVAGGTAMSDRIGAAVVVPPRPRVLRSGQADIHVLGRGDLDLPEGALDADPVATFDLDLLTVRVVVRTSGNGVPLWARVHRGRERVFVAALRAVDGVLVADLLLPDGTDSFVVDVVDRLSAPAPHDGPGPQRRAIESGRRAVAAVARAVDSSIVGNDLLWTDASAAWLGAGEDWDDLSDHGRAVVAAALALHAAVVAGHDGLAAAARRLRDRTIEGADHPAVALAGETAAARLLGRPRSAPDVLSPLLVPRFRSVLGRPPLAGGGDDKDRLDAGLARLAVVAELIDDDATQRRTVALALRGWSLACGLLGRADLAADAAQRSAALAGVAGSSGSTPA